MSGIFICYRREDSSGYAGRLYDGLSSHFSPAQQIFMDIDVIPPGMDFVTTIEEAIASCHVLLAVIGRQWLTCADDEGRRRLNVPGDYVRREIEAALSRNIRVIPVLVQGAPMPSARDLPAALKTLTRRQAHELTDTRWPYDMNRLIKTLETQPYVTDPVHSSSSSGSTHPEAEGTPKTPSTSQRERQAEEKEQRREGSVRLRPHISVRWQALTGAVTIGVAGLLFVLWIYLRGPDEPPPPVIIGVMHFRDLHDDPQRQWMEEAMRDSLNAELSAASDLKVYAKEQLDFLIQKDFSNMIAVAKDLGIAKLISNMDEDLILLFDREPLSLRPLSNCPHVMAKVVQGIGDVLELME